MALHCRLHMCGDDARMGKAPSHSKTGWGRLLYLDCPGEVSFLSVFSGRVCPGQHMRLRGLVMVMLLKKKTNQRSTMLSCR